MINTLIVSIFTALALGVMPVNGLAPKTPEVLGVRQFSLNTRYAVKSVNEVMKKNILLNLAYLNGSVSKKTDIDWDKVMAFTDYSFTLNPGETFAFHNSVLAPYKDKTVKTTNAHFSASDGFLYDGYLYGDGVCHLASLINYAAYDAGL